MISEGELLFSIDEDGDLVIQDSGDDDVFFYLTPKEAIDVADWIYRYFKRLN